MRFFPRRTPKEPYTVHLTQAQVDLLSTCIGHRQVALLRRGETPQSAEFKELDQIEDLLDIAVLGFSALD